MGGYSWSPMYTPHFSTFFIGIHLGEIVEHSNEVYLFVDGANARFSGQAGPFVTFASGKIAYEDPAVGDELLRFIDDIKSNSFFVAQTMDAWYPVYLEWVNQTKPLVDRMPDGKPKEEKFYTFLEEWILDASSIGGKVG